MARSKFTPICLLVYFLCFGVFVSSVWGKVLEYKWKVEYMFHAPDCIEKPVMGINGQFPGPPIEAEVGDTIFVYLTNKLHTEGVVIHWHGIRQRGTPWADGTASISQCAINPEETFIYEFVVDKEGTYFYHGHYGMQRSAGLYGMLIVKPKDVNMEPFKYDGEFSLLLSDWWHHGVHEQAVNLSSNPVRWIGEPQTLLINGKGRYRCPLTAGLTSHKDPDLPECKLTGDKRCKPVILDVVPGKTYRLRVASTTALAALNVAIQDHKMDLVEADGNYVQRVQVDDFDIYSGETYSVIFTANQKTFNNYWIRVGPRGRKPGSPAALAILRYVTNPSLQLPTSPPPKTPDWNNYDHSKTFSKLVLGHAQIEKPGKTYDHRIFLLNTQNLIEGQTKWAINNVSLTLPATPYLGAIRYGIAGAFDEKRPSDTFLDTYDIEKPPPNLNCTSSSGIYKLELHKTVDVILQNANMIKPGVTEIHPWHLHGHDFWVLGYGEGKFSSEKHESSLNLVNPPLKNTVVIFPRGWTAIRFVADNPGVWAFHCHIEPHLHMGMGVIFEEGVDQLKRLIPAETLACGLTGQTLLKNHQYVNLGN